MDNIDQREYRTKIHPHILKRNYVQNGWGCDGQKEQGGCRKGCTGFNQTAGWARFRCISGCDYDLCDQCLRFHAA